jgi:hypothetical protein
MAKEAKKRIRTQSAKAKGRRLQKWACSKISDLTGFSCGKDMPIESRPMGQSGVDVRMESQVLKAFPYSVECKCQEAWSMHAWIKQACANVIEGTDWLLICKRNSESPIIVMDGDAFFRLLGKLAKGGRNGNK